MDSGAVSARNKFDAFAFAVRFICGFLVFGIIAFFWRGSHGDVDIPLTLAVGACAGLLAGWLGDRFWEGASHMFAKIRHGL